MTDQRYWMSTRDLEAPATPTPEREGEGDDAAWSRRSFLRATGFGVASAAFLAGCSPAPVRKAIPFLVPAEEIVPGEAYYHASTCGGCPAGCGLMTKNRDGRPVKLEGFRGAEGPGDRSHPVSGGGLCAVGQASLLGLYDSRRLEGPLLGGEPSDWKVVDALVGERLRSSAGRTVLLTGTVTGPTTRARIEDLMARHAGVEHVVYDVPGCTAMLDAHEALLGRRVLPRLRFEEADVVVGVGCDFLGTWVSPVEYTAGYASRRRHGGDEVMSWHLQVESVMNLTSAKADRRMVATRREQIAFLTGLAAALASRAGRTVPRGAGTGTAPDGELVERLWAARGRSLVVAGVDDPDAQNAAVFINEVLGNYGATLDLERCSSQRQGDDAALLRLIDEMKAGRVGTLVIRGVNPIYDLPARLGFAEAFERVETTVCVATAPDETTAAADVVCPEPHFLEAWDDAMPLDGVLCMTQPAIAPLFDTRGFREHLAAWGGDETRDEDYRRRVLEKRVDWRSTGARTFDEFWNRAVHDGFVELPATAAPRAAVKTPVFTPAPGVDGEGFELAVVAQAGMLDGRHAHNAWLQEMPDPVTKISWGNAASIGVGAAARLGIEDGDVVELKSDGVAIELPAHVQPGQHDSVIAVPMGYGRAGTDRFARVGPDWIEAEATVEDGGVVGVNVAPLLGAADGRVRTDARVEVRRTGRRSPLALAQTWGSIDVPANTAPGGERRRPHVIMETTTGKLDHAHDEAHAHHHPDSDLWSDDHANEHPQWGMSIDLNRCTGCSACVVACQVENNVPVVGKDEVKRRRDMYWLRIDRYYSGDPADPEDVDVVQQPMMCQHCGNAPCETVCPVLATVHSEEGLNQQVYNRCVGTRYCANNCPYKVRRFNWFDYAHEDQLQNMALNPDIAVRSRGVMEKCSFCVQRIQEAKAEAKRRGVPLDDDAIQPACIQTCPAEAIVFGNRANPESTVARALGDGTSYRVLGELNVKPAVGYRTLVRNRRDEGD